MRSTRWWWFTALASARACSPQVRQAVEARKPCERCEELLWMCDHAPRDWNTVDEVRSLVAELRLEEL